MKIVCSMCKREVPPVAEGCGGTGYGVDRRGRKVCYQCCATADMDAMEREGKITLYLNEKERKLTNWPGTLKITLDYLRVGGHNIGGRRVDVWFRSGCRRWHGVQYGNNTELCHCRRLAHK